MVAATKNAPKATKLDAQAMGDKSTVIKKHQTHDKDTGSAPVQIAILTQKIAKLAGHLEDHKKDNHSRKGLLGMVGKRRKLLNYLKLNDSKQYSEVLSELGLRK